MSVGSILNTAMSSMQANQLALAVSSNNIANSQTPGYSRERLVTRPAEGLGGLSAGAGVEVIRIQALRSELIDTRLRQETSEKAHYDSLSTTLSDIEVLFNETEDSGLQPILTNFFNSFHTLSTDPSSISFREQVRTNTQILADAFAARAESLRDIQTMTNSSIANNVNQANDLLNQIASLTVSIKEQEAQQPANELRDQRGTLVRELSKIMDVRELESGNDYHLTTSSNRLLVLNGTGYPLTTDTSPVTGFLTVRSGQSDITAELGVGELKAKIMVRDEYIPKYMTALDNLAYEIVGEVNTVHAAGYNLDGGTGVDFFTPIASATGAARLMSLSAAVAADPRKIAAAKDTAGNNNLAAIDLGNLLHNPVFTGGAVTEQYGNLVFSVGSDVSNAGSALRHHEALEHQLEVRRGAVSGVSIDEETLQMLGFQRAYEASARLVRTVDELLQVLLAMGN